MHKPFLSFFLFVVCVVAYNSTGSTTNSPPTATSAAALQFGPTSPKCSSRLAHTTAHWRRPTSATPSFVTAFFFWCQSNECITLLNAL